MRFLAQCRESSVLTQSDLSRRSENCAVSVVRDRELPGVSDSGAGRMFTQTDCERIVLSGLTIR